MALARIDKNSPGLNRASQKIVRKQQLVDATIDCINRLGLSQTTLAKIAERAGVSQGIVSFHFRSKDILLEQTLLHLSNEYSAAWHAAHDTAGERSIQKLCAIVASAFHPKLCTRKKISVWYAFWGESHSRPKYREVCGQIDGEFSEVVLELCKDICADGQARVGADVAALGIEGMIDGLWQNCLVLPEPFNRKTACRTVFELMEAIFPKETKTIQQYKSAQV